MAKKGTRVKGTVIEGRSFLERMEGGVWGLGIAVMGVLMLMALVSYVWRRSGDGALDGTNLIGPVGAHLALHIYTVLGMAGALLTVSVIAFGGLLIAQRMSDLRREHLLGIAVILFPLAVLLHFVTPESTTLPWGWGGVLGEVLGDWVLARLLGKAGTWLLGIAAIIAGLSIIFRIHVKSFFFVPYVLCRRLLALGRRADGEEDEEGTEAGTEEGTAALDGSADAAASNARVVRKEGEEGATNVQKPKVLVAELLHDEVEEPAKKDDAPEPPPAPEPEPDPDATRPNRPAADETQANRAVVRERSDLLSEDEFEASLDGDEGENEGEDDGEDTSRDGHVPPDSARVVRKKKRAFEMPDVGLLDYHPPSAHEVDDGQLHDAARKLEEKLQDFKIDGTVGDIHPGPVIALYEFKPGRGVKLSTISSLSKDIAMALAAEQVRIVAPIPGRDVVGFEIPNKVREMVYLRDSLSHGSYRQGKHRLPLVLGKDIAGNPSVTDLTKMPHLLVAGTTGSGKSVAIHSFILSIIYRRSPKEVRFIFVDPKMLELTAYAEIPHLLLPVVTEAKDAAVALAWAVGEMERRNRLMSAAGVPNITEFNQWVAKRRESDNGKAALRKVTHGIDGSRREQIFAHENEELEELPYIVVVIDELADLMMVAGKLVESSIARLAQMARAAGIHMIIATQNPTIKVVTGIIKANMPSRISFKVRTMQDSRVILDQNGADDLLGYGDMLFLGPGSSKLKRIHGSFVSTEERNRVVEYLRTQGSPEYNADIMATLEAGDEEEAVPGGSGDPNDDIYSQAVTIAVARGKISTSALQRELGVGYNKAAVLMSRMEKEGIVGPPEAAGKPRVVLRSR
jgi:DNA segregation ATPase FtsK/SpoIIIE-like protein